MLTFDDPRWRALLAAFVGSLGRRGARLTPEQLQRCPFAPWPLKPVVFK